MSEPSLRDTAIARAMGEFYPSGGAPDEAIAEDVARVVDAALRVIHTQRDAIADAAAAVHFEWAMMGDGERDTRLASGRGMEDDVADAVLATLGAESDRATA